MQACCLMIFFIESKIEGFEPKKKYKMLTIKNNAFVFFYAVVGGKEALERKIERLLAKTHKLDAKGAQQGSALVAGEYCFFNFLIFFKKN